MHDLKHKGHAVSSGRKYVDRGQIDRGQTTSRPSRGFGNIPSAKTFNKGIDQRGKAQAVAKKQQIVIAVDGTHQANDVRPTIPMVDQTIGNLDEAGVEECVGVFTANTGYFSEGNIESLDSNARIDGAFVATGRQKPIDPVAKSPRRFVSGASRHRCPNDQTAAGCRRNGTSDHRERVLDIVLGCF